MLVDCDQLIAIPYESIPDAYDHLYGLLDARGAVDRETMARIAPLGGRPNPIITEGRADPLPEEFPEWFRDAHRKGSKDAGPGLALSALLQSPGRFPLGECDSVVDAGTADFHLFSFAAAPATVDELRTTLAFVAEILRFAERPWVDLDVREGDYETRYRVSVREGEPHLRSRPKRGTNSHDFKEVAWDDPRLGLADEPSPAGWVAAARDTRAQPPPDPGRPN